LTEPAKFKVKHKNEGHKLSLKEPTQNNSRALHNEDSFGERPEDTVPLNTYVTCASTWHCIFKSLSKRFLIKYRVATMSRLLNIMGLAIASYPKTPFFPTNEKGNAQGFH